ncbi:hypothetical protein EIP91_001909 [Steccherinum ochraceum]|uniref:Uncharacterized protein n=1 Tax=Steccherinum ochraceum TaxID=92696 RepID=A0A4R0RLK2_9APHY|nr:hypothetical protein EIP91_001909 [Steccherinum ochraceum]
MVRTQVLIDRLVIFQEALYDYRDSYAFDSDTHLLRVVDLCASPEVLEVLYLDPEMVIDKVAFRPIMPRLGEICDFLRKSFEESLEAKLLASLHTSFEGGIDKLTLATTWFAYNCGASQTCQREDHRKKPMRHTAVMEMVCDETVSPGFNIDYTSGASDAELRNATIHLFQASPWFVRAGWIGPDVTAFRVARYVVTLCGKDSDTATADDMDTLDARFLCLSCCRDVPPKPCVVTWRGAIHHKSSCSAYWGDTREWRLLTDVDASVVKREELRELNDKEVWRCASCPQRPATTLRNLYSHQASTHSDTGRLTAGSSRARLDPECAIEHPMHFKRPYQQYLPQPLIRGR